MDESLDSELFVLVSIPPFPISFFCCDLFPWTVLCLSLRVPDPTPPLAPSSSITRASLFPTRPVDRLLCSPFILRPYLTSRLQVALYLSTSSPVNFQHAAALHGHWP